MEKRQLQRLSHTLSLINDCVYVTNMNDTVIYVNQAFCEIYGFEENEIIGKKSIVFLEDNYQFSTEEIVNQEVNHCRNDGSGLAVSISRTLIKDERNNSSALLVVSRDMSAQKKLEQELIEVKEKAESMNFELLESNKYLHETTTMAKELATQAEIASSAKTDFLANMSHEIRTPLNAIIGMIDLVLDTDLELEQREYLEIAHSSSEGLLSLINEILDFSKIEAGGMILEETSFNLREIIEESIDIFGYRAQLKGLELIGFVEPQIPHQLIGDPVRMRQVIINLIGNAIKFTEQGEVVVKVETTTVPSGQEHAIEKCNIRFSVSDTGVGISKSQLKLIFNKFSQADNSTTRKYGGTGLGLNIAKSLIELMGGELKVESEENKGSVFKFILNFPIDKTTESKAEYPFDNSESVSVLLVNSRQTDQMLLNKYLSAWGFEIHEAADKNQVESFLSATNFNVDIIIVDHELHEIVENVVAQYPVAQESKIIVTVPYKMTGLKQNKPSRVTAFLNKPIKQSKLLNVVKGVLDNSIEVEQVFEPENLTIVDNQKKQTRIKIVKENVEGDLANKAKILLVEDHPDNQLLFSKILESNGYRLSIASNGLDAVSLAKELDFDLILMDIYMPQLDGFGATRRIRAYEIEEKKARIPIIALTAHAIDGYKEKCIEQGMDDYLTKPVRKKVLLAKIDEWISKTKAIIAQLDA